MSLEDFSKKKMFLNRLWRKLDRARNMNCSPNSLVKLRHKIYDTQDEIALFLVSNNRSDEVVYRRKTKITADIFQNLDHFD